MSNILKNSQTQTLYPNSEKEIQEKKKFRVIVENCTAMINNDEIIYYRDTCPEGYKFLQKRILLRRPIFLEEKINLEHVEQGEIPLYEETPSALTRILDGIYRLQEEIQRMNFLFKEHPNKEKVCSPSEIVANILATNYYDCLSGGMPIGLDTAIQLICKDPRINPDTEVYPSDKGYYTIKDYLDGSLPFSLDTEEALKKLQDIKINPTTLCLPQPNP